uniref:Uncharacterized protein n=1 Tax=Globodera rostochiensis TaxID=31243 RepID=A0A914HB05_GLORO
MSTNFKIGIEKREAKRQKRKEERRSSGQRMNAAISVRKLAQPSTSIAMSAEAVFDGPIIQFLFKLFSRQLM